MPEKNPTPNHEQLPNNYELSVSNQEETGVRLFNLHDSETEVTAVFVEFNDEYDVHAAVPWAGARTSRSDDPHEQIYAEIRDVSHADKIDMFFGYGHASIANMSPTMIHLNNLPMQEAYWIFNHLTLVGGQETSTRYVELSNPTVTELDRLVDLNGLEATKAEELTTEWEAISEKAHAGFAKWFPRIRDDLLDFVRQEHPDAGEKAMDKRALDAARAWLPFGGRTSMSLQFDVREAIGLITQLNQRDDHYGGHLAQQLTTLYRLKRYQGSEDIQADLAGLMKYTEGSGTVGRNTQELEHRLMGVAGYEDLENLSVARAQEEPLEVKSNITFTPENAPDAPGNEVVAAYILTLLPNLHYTEALNFVNQLPEGDRKDLIGTVFDGHTQHDLMRNAADVRGHMVEIDTALAYQRDFNRHRAMGRLAVMFETDNHDAVIRSGFNRSHVLSRTRALHAHEAEWNHDMSDLYRDIYAFYEKAKGQFGPNHDYSFIYHILPLTHQSKLLMSGPLMQWNYFNHLRIRPGGDYGYREVTHDIARAVHTVTGITSAQTTQAPDYNNSGELLDRT